VDGCTGFLDDLARVSGSHHAGVRAAVGAGRAVCEGCKLGVDPCADHTLACKSGKKGGGWKTRRHNACQRLLLGLAKAAGLEAVMEAGVLGTRRPGHIKVFWFEGSGPF
jgi:hypothetical protein